MNWHQHSPTLWMCSLWDATHTPNGWIPSHVYDRHGRYPAFRTAEAAMQYVEQLRD